MRLMLIPLGASMIVSCTPARAPQSNAPVGVAKSTVDDPARASAACVEPKLAPAKKRDDGIDAFLGGRVSEALDLLDDAVRSDPSDRAANAFRRGTMMKIDARKTRAAEELKMIAPVVLAPVPTTRTHKRSIEGITGGKVKLEKESEKKNLITDNNDWEKRNQLSSPRVDAARVDSVAPPAVGDRPHSVFKHADHVVAIYSSLIVISGDGRRTVVFDTTEVVRGGFQIGFAQLVGGTLIVQAGNNGSAKEAKGKNAYLAAYDGGNGSVVWSSEPLVASAAEAIVTGGSIITGYGFTAEPDFVFVLDLATGAVEQKIAVKKSPEAIRAKGDRVYVRTYDTDYVFKSATPLAAAPPSNLSRYADAMAPVDAETRCFVRNATAAIAARDRAALKLAVDALSARSKDRLLLEFLRSEESQLGETRRFDLAAAPFVALPAPPWDATSPTTAKAATDPKLVKVKSAKSDASGSRQSTFSPGKPWFIAPADANTPLPEGVRADIPRTFGLEDLRAILPHGDKTLLVYGGRFLAIVRGDVAERVFDFETFRHPPKVNPQYKEFAVQDVTYAEVEDGILYVCNGGGSYAKEVFGKKGFLSAIEVSSGKLLWRSAPLTCNSTFVISGAHIISGYGFTDEPDFVFLVRRADGAIVQRVPVDTAPESISVDKNRVHVETYGQAIDLELR
jgi:hypothetical protein